MGRGQESKLRRRQQRAAGGGGGGGDDPFGENEEEEALPMPPRMAASKAPPKKKKPPVVVEDVSSSDDDEDNGYGDDDHDNNMPKKKGRNRHGRGGAVPHTGKGGGIKTMPLILLILLTGTTLLPALIFASDFLSTYLAKNNVLGAIGYRLGIGQVPRRRVLSFYEKHAPDKLDDVPQILAKHYGTYPTLIKKLERKYQDYGYFIGWEDDEAPLKLALEQVRDTYNTWITGYWNRYAPQVLKTAARNVRYNLTTVVKKGKRLWKKHVWPALEPFLGVPKGAEQQKRQDAAEARKRRASSSSSAGGTRRKNTAYRDDEEEEDEQDF